MQERGYAVKDDSQLFEPTPLGEALIGAYDNMGLKTVYECVPLGIESVKGWPHQCNDSFTLITRCTRLHSVFFISEQPGTGGKQYWWKDSDMSVAPCPGIPFVEITQRVYDRGF